MIRLVSVRPRSYVVCMGVFDGMHENVRKTGREWADWARRHARDMSERGIRHLERQDLLTERKRLVVRVGEYTVQRIIDEDKKTIRADAVDLVDLTDRIRAIDARLSELDDDDSSELTDAKGDGDESDNATKDG